MREALIGLFGDDPNDFMAKCGAKWLHKQGVNVMAMSPGKKNYSHVNCPIGRVQIDIDWLKERGSSRFGVMGMSTAGMHALAAGSLPKETKGSGNFMCSRFPVGLRFVLKFVFKAARDFPKECEQTRIDIDHRLSYVIQSWRKCPE